MIILRTRNILKMKNKILRFFLLFFVVFLCRYVYAQNAQSGIEIIDSTISIIKINSLTKHNIDSTFGLSKGVVSKNFSIKSYDNYSSSIDLLIHNSYYMTIWAGKGEHSNRFSFIEICRKQKSVKQKSYIKSIQWDTLPKSGRGVYLGMATSEFSSVMKNIVFDRVYSYKNYWVFEFFMESKTPIINVKDTFQLRDLRHYLTDVHTPSKNQLAEFKLRQNNSNSDKFIARYIFYNYKLVKYGFGYYPFFPTGTYEGLIY